MPSPHRWHGDVPRVQHEPVASTEAGHQRQLSKWLVGCAGFYRRGHAKRQRPYYWMRELPVPAIILRVGGAAGWTSGCHRRRIQQSGCAGDQHRVHVRSSGEHMVSANNCTGNVVLRRRRRHRSYRRRPVHDSDERNDACREHREQGYRVVQSRDADLQCTRPDGQGRHQQRGRLESTAERDIPDCRFKDPNVLRNLRFRDQLVGDRADPPW